MMHFALLLVSGRSAAWLAHLLWEQRVGGSNPSAPTKKTLRASGGFFASGGSGGIRKESGGSRMMRRSRTLGVRRAQRDGAAIPPPRPKKPSRKRRFFCVWRVGGIRKESGGCRTMRRSRTLGVRRAQRDGAAIPPCRGKIIPHQVQCLLFARKSFSNSY